MQRARIDGPSTRRGRPHAQLAGPGPGLALTREIAGTAYLLAPLLGAALLHGLFMKYHWLSVLARPMDFGRTWRGRPLFGHSKTFRGPILVAAGSAAVFAVQQQVLHRFEFFAALELVDYASLPVWLGALAGALAELAELPNSFTKRQLGVAPGATTKGPLALLFFVWDQLDLLLGYWLAFAWFVTPTPFQAGVSIALVGGIHPLLTLIGYVLGMRPTAR